jgi:predicted RND superfamily exporter protein
VAASVRGAAAALAGTPALVAGAGSRAWRAAQARPGRILRIGLVLAALGWLATTQIDVTSDQRRLLPADRLEARDLASLERETGTPGDVNVLVRSERLLDPAVVQWMSSYHRRVLRRNGFRAGRPCREADLCPSLSLTNLFGADRQRPQQIRATVDALPRYFSQNVITPDRRTANIAFRMGAIPPEERRQVVDSLRAELDPPAGVDADLAGPVVAAAEGEGDLETSMWLVTLIALLVVTAVAGLASRSLEGGMVVAIPLALATGWTFLVLFLLPVDVDFLTAGLGAIVIAICAGPVALAVRAYAGGRREGGSAEAAIERVRESGKRPAVGFAAVAVAGFLALTVCDIPALRELGASAAVALPLAGLGLAAVLPATLVWVDRRGGLRVPRTRAELAAAGRALLETVRAGVRAGGRGARRTALAIRRAVVAIPRAIPRAGRKVRALVASRR